jgi:porin
MGNHVSRIFLLLLASMTISQVGVAGNARAGVFMNGGFGTALDLSGSGKNGPCVFPTSRFDLRLTFQTTPADYVQIAVFDGVAGDPDNRTQVEARLSR